MHIIWSWRFRGVLVPWVSLEQRHCDGGFDIYIMACFAILHDEYDNFVEYVHTKIATPLLRFVYFVSPTDQTRLQQVDIYLSCNYCSYLRATFNSKRKASRHSMRLNILAFSHDLANAT